MPKEKLPKGDNMKAEKNLVVERETYEKGDKTYFQYFVPGVIKGKQVKAKLTASDIGGYEVLDIVFIGNERAELGLVPYAITDEATGKVNNGFTYEARTTDKDGTVYKAKVKPLRPSDKALIDMLLAQLG